MRRVSLFVATLLMLGCGQIAQHSGGAATLDGTSWRLVKFQGGDDTVLTPDDRAKYTIAFAADGTLNVRFDCNRGRGTWKSTAPTQLQFGPLALTRAACPPGSLHDRMVKQWPFIRSYVFKGGHLFLSLMADGGIYEFEPAEGAVQGTATEVALTLRRVGAAATLENTYWKLTHFGSEPITVVQRL